MILTPTLQKILEQCSLHTKVSAKVLFPDRFTRDFSSFSDPIFSVLDNPEIQKAVIIAPRGWGKTSTVNLAYPAKNILFQEKHFIVPISNTATQAVMQGENLKRELISNIMINKLFGSMKSNNFSKEMWETSTGTAVMPRGKGQQVRGILYGNHRPDLIIGDDIEDSESVLSEEQRDKTKEWFFADVLNSVDRARSDWKVVVIGTLLHEDCLLSNLVKDKSWYSIHISLCDDSYKSNWPEYMSDEAVKELVESYRVQGKLDTFYREYMGLPISKEDAVFQPGYFKYYNETSEEFRKRLHQIETVILLDPAKTTKLSSAESGIVAVGLDAELGRIYVRDAVGEKLHPDQIYDRVFNMAELFKARVIGLEVTSLNEFITYPITNAMIHRRKIFEIIELKARDKKENRVAALAPFYRLGHVFHNETLRNSALETQLLTFPRPSRWDIMDALAYIVELLDIGERFFAPYSDGDFEDKPQDIESEYETLEYEPALEGWQTV